VTSPVATPPRTRARIRHISALDGIRGAAVAGVLLFHGGHLNGGYLGVDTFFVLSGFLITSLLLAEIGSTVHVNLGAFWARRARRLLPALGVMLLGVAAYAALIAPPEQLHLIRMDALATVAYVANWRAVFSGFNYWALFTAPSPLDHTWSLAIEEQFYVIWPLVVTGLLAMGRRGADRSAEAVAKRILVTAVVLGAVSAFLSLAFYSWYGANRVYYGTDTRAFAILAGIALAALIALLGPVTARRPRLALEVVGIGSALFLTAAAFSLKGQSLVLYRGGLLACSVAAAIVVAASVQPAPGPLSKLLSIRPLTALGLISYGVYLYHWPIFVWLSPARTHLHGWPLFVVRVAVTIAVAVISYRFVEQPIRHGWRPAIRTGVVYPAAAALVVVALLIGTAGYRPPPHGAVTTDAATAAATRARNAAPPGSLRLMVAGNSVAWYLAREGFRPTVASHDVALYNAADPACVYPKATRAKMLSGGIVGRQPGCDTFWKTSTERFKPDAVVLTFADFGTGGFEHNGRFVQPCTPGFDDWMRSDLTDKVRFFRSQGARVVLVTSLYAGANFIIKETPIGRRMTDCANQVERDVARLVPGTTAYDLNGRLCQRDGPCREQIGDIVVRPDGLHLRHRSAELVASWLYPLITAGRTRPA
jgi:peptidoglycan/LPS O-acetylase OafA/YrhL